MDQTDGWKRGMCRTGLRGFGPRPLSTHEEKKDELHNRDVFVQFDRFVGVPVLNTTVGSTHLLDYLIFAVDPGRDETQALGRHGAGWWVLHVHSG